MGEKLERLVIPAGITIKLAGLPFELSHDTIVVCTRENFELAMQDSEVKEVLFYRTMSKFL